MATVTVTDTKFLQKESNLVSLKITIGQAQAGGSFVVLIASDGVREEILPDPNGEYFIQTQLNSILGCITTVQDINLSTNMTSVLHDFSNATPNHFDYHRPVEHHNDKVVYDIQYIFI